LYAHTAGGALRTIYRKIDYLYVTIKEISHVPTENGQDSVVAVLPYEIDKGFAHVTHQFKFGDLQYLKKHQNH